MNQFNVLLWPQATRKFDLCLSVQIRVQHKLKSNPFRFTRNSSLATIFQTCHYLLVTCHSFLVTRHYSLVTQNYFFKLVTQPINLIYPACPMKCLPNEMRSLFHRDEAYFIGVKYRQISLPC